MWQYIIGVNVYLMEKQQEENATAFYYYFRARGATVQAICGMLGNINWESGLNPGRKQTTSTTSGWGLIQWTPSSNLTDYAIAHGTDWATGEIQTQLMWDEIINGYGSQWKPKPSLGYGYTGAEFSQLTDVAEACKAYLYERERAGVEALTKRLTYANNWYEYLTGVTPPTPPTPPAPTNRKRMPLWMMCRPLF